MFNGYRFPNTLKHFYGFSGFGLNSLYRPSILQNISRRQFRNVNQFRAKAISRAKIHGRSVPTLHYTDMREVSVRRTQADRQICANLSSIGTRLIHRLPRWIVGMYVCIQCTGMHWFKISESIFYHQNAQHDLWHWWNWCIQIGNEIMKIKNGHKSRTLCSTLIT